jgi:hypothetical protein
MNRKKILKWVEKYNEDPSLRHDKKEERRILKEVSSVKNCDDLIEIVDGRKGILSWKASRRSSGYYKSLRRSRKKREEFSDIVKKSKANPKETVKELRAFSQKKMYMRTRKGQVRRGGIRYPTASTIVHFFSKGNCPIIDWRAVDTLMNEGYDEDLDSIGLYGVQLDLDDGGWEDYFNLCQKLVKDFRIEPIGGDTPLRVLDKALWIYPDLPDHMK